MKRRTSLWVLTGVLLVAAAGAQAAENQLGIKVGLAVQELGGDGVDDLNVDSRTGFVGGGYFQRDFSTHFGMRLEALYYMKGASGDSADIDVTIKLDYVEFPLLLVANIPFSDSGRLSLFGGPTFAINTNAEAEASLGGGNGTLTADIEEAVKGFDLGLTFGAGFNFDAGNVIFGIDGRYGFGLDTVIDSDALADVGIPIDSDDDVKNQGFAFMVSLGFPLGAE